MLHDLSTTFMQPAEAVEAEDRGTAKDGEDVEMRLPCTGVSWSSTGSVVCASFGRLDHSGWCTHRAGVATWNVFKKDMNPEKPENVLETMSCVMCVACHPEMPSVVAAGTFNGEVAVWDTNLPEPHVAQSRIDDYFHREPVSRVEWVYDMFARTYMIASVSADGKVLFWTLKNKLAYPIQGFRLAPQCKCLCCPAHRRRRGIAAERLGVRLTTPPPQTVCSCSLVARAIVQLGGVGATAAVTRQSLEARRWRSRKMAATARLSWWARKAAASSNASCETSLGLHASVNAHLRPKWRGTHQRRRRSCECRKATATPWQSTSSAMRGRTRSAR